MSKFRRIVESILSEKSFFASNGIIDSEYASSYDFKNGEEVTVEAYHMTPHTFTKFKIGEVNAWGKGVYLTNNPQDCSFNIDNIKNWNKMRLYATFFKPFIYEEYMSNEFVDWIWSEIKKVITDRELENSGISKLKLGSEESYMDTYYRMLFKNFANTMLKKQSSLSMIETIKNFDKEYGLSVYDKLDIDGMILPFRKAGCGKEDTVWYVCYRPNQIKSYENNNGNFDLNKDDINE